MIIECEYIEGVDVEEFAIRGVPVDTIRLHQTIDAVVISKQQATQLIEVLTKWIETGEVE